MRAKHAIVHIFQKTEDENARLYTPKWFIEQWNLSQMIGKDTSIIDNSSFLSQFNKS